MTVRSEEISTNLFHSETRTLLCHVNKSEPFWKQYLAAFLASIISLSSGCVGGWSSPATPILLQGTSDLGVQALSINEASWVGSLINLGAFFGSIPAGYISFKWGRKNCLLILAWPIIIGWLLILFNNNNVLLLYIGRFVSGISYGSLNVALPIYNNEICNDEIRGRIGVFYDLMQSIGLLWVYFFGAVISLFWTTILCLLLPIIFLFTFVWMPESPLYLVRINRIDRAIESIKWLHGENCNTDIELQRIHQALLEGNINSNKILKSFSLNQCLRDFFKNFRSVTTKAVFITFFMFVLQRTCGATMVQYYGSSIFQLSYSAITSDFASVLIGVISVIGSLISILTVDTIGRRFLLIFSFFIMTLSLAVFNGYLIFMENENNLSYEIYPQNYYGLVPVVSLCLFVAMFRIGVSPIPWFMAPEIIPTEAQKWAQSTIVCITWGTSFLLSKSFLPAIQAFGQIPVYSFFLLVCAIGILYTYIFIPETKNKSRKEIQRELGGATESYYEAI